MSIPKNVFIGGLVIFLGIIFFTSSLLHCALFLILGILVCITFQNSATVEGFAETSSPKIKADNNTKAKSKSKSESMTTLTSNSQYLKPVQLDEKNFDTFLSTNFHKGTASNPFSNPLLTDIGDSPNRLSAPPAFDPTVKKGIDKNIKRAVQTMNPTIDAQKQLFDGPANVFATDISNRQFYSVANTRISNDQGAFSQYLYGDMPSGKEDGARSALAREHSSIRHTLR
jgi:cytoskeletal protein RodZ